MADRAAALVAELGIGEAVAVHALAGGVSSDIATVTLADGRRVVVKFALPRLRVAAAWEAPVHRSRAEYAWLGVAGRVVPGRVPALLGWSDALMGFAMEAVEGPGVRLWKAELLAGAPERGEAQAVGDALGRVHAASVAPGFDRAPFLNAADFAALRVDPYLRAAATRHPALAPRLLALADALDGGGAVLVHGDVSPKNVLLRGAAPVLLDAECATMGDPAFDVAFCVNHLLLKAVHRPIDAPERRAGALALWRAYAAHVAWEDAASLEARVAGLVPALFLARVDGLSPVEYLRDEARGLVRARAPPLLHEPPATLQELWERAA